MPDDDDGDERLYVTVVNCLYDDVKVYVNLISCEIKVENYGYIKLLLRLRYSRA